VAGDSQPARASAAVSASNPRHKSESDFLRVWISEAGPLKWPAMDALLWLLLEAGVALALLIFIVWWTMPRRQRNQDSESEGRDR